MLITSVIGLVFSYLIVTVFAVGSKPDEALNRDLENMYMQIGVQASSVIFLPITSTWNVATDLGSSGVAQLKWLVAIVLFTAATLLMHYYHYEVLSIIDDGWTCAIVPIMRNIISPMLQIQRVLFAIVTPIVNAFIIIQAQILKGWIGTLATCSHINLFKILAEFSKAIITATMSIASWFGYGSELSDENNFYYNDFNISRPVNHSLTAISVSQEVLACACKRFEPLFNIGFFITQEPHVTAMIDNGFQFLVRILQMIVRLLFKEFPDIYKVTFKLERAANEAGLAFDSVLFNMLQNFIKMLSPDFEITKRPLEGPFSVSSRLGAAASHVSSTVFINGPLHVLATFDPNMNAFDPKVWSLERALSHAHTAIYDGAVLVQWIVYVMERLVTDTVNIGDVFTDENTPLELSCDWARDVEDHKYVSISYTAGCSLYYMGIIPVNSAYIAYASMVELLTKSIFTQEQNVFRTLQRWEGPTIARNKVYTCEDRQKLTAYDYTTGKNYTKSGGWLWTQDRSKCNCERNYGETLEEGIPFYNPWCGQPNLNFDVFASMDALVMHVSHGILGPGFGDAFPFIDPIQNIEIDIEAGSKSIKKTIALPFPLPPLTRTAIESIRVMTRVVLSFGDIVTGHFFNYPVNCGHGLNSIQLRAKYKVENGGNEYAGPGSLAEETMRWGSCKSKQYKPMRSAGKRTEVCDKNNNSPLCMCSYLQKLEPDSECMCISRYPDLDVTSSTQEVGDLIEKRFTSESVAHHWCNSMIIEWTFQNTAAFADALDYMVSLGPINPTCDVMDRIIENKALGVDELDQRSKSAYLIANTPTLRFVGEFMDAETKLNHIKDLYSETRAGCVIEPSAWQTATDEYGNVIYEKDADGNPTDTPVKVMTQPEWSCDASNSFVSIASLNKNSDDEETQPGCRIWGRNDFFCSAGLFVRNSKRLSMNIARQAINDGISIMAGNFEDINLRTLPRLCDYERQQGAVAAMIAGLIPKISLELKQAFAKYINMILQIVFVQGLRTTLTLAQMATTIVTDFVDGSIDKDSIESTFQQGVDTLADGFLYAVRYFFDTTGEILDAVSPGAGSICDSIVEIIDMLSAQIKEELMDLLALVMKVGFQLLGAITGDASQIGPFFTNVFKLWFEIQTIVIRRMWDILDKIYDFFGPIGKFFKVLTYGVCLAINGIMYAIDAAIRTITFGTTGLDWDEMECVEPKLSGTHGNHTSGTLGKHFLKTHDNEEITTRIANTLDWNGTSVCDHFMTGAADYSYTELRPLEKAKWLECLEYKLIGIEIAKFVNSKTFPTDIAYNWKRKYVLMYEAAQALRIITSEYASSGKMDWAHTRLMLIEHGLDADMYIQLFRKFTDIAGEILTTVELTNFVEFVFENIDPKYNVPDNPSTTALAWKTFKNTQNIYTSTQQKWTEKDMTKQMWTAIDASYDAHKHLQHWWSSIGKEVPHQTHTERVFANFKTNLKSMWKENVVLTNLHKKLHKKLSVPVKTGIQSCSERGDPEWCTDCVVADNIIETVLEQGQAIGHFYSERFPIIINNVSGYFDELAEYNAEFFEGTFSRLQSEKPKVPKNSIRWTYHVERDWKDFFNDFGTYIQNGTHKEIWLGQIDKFLEASRLFVQSTSDEYVPFYGYSFHYMYQYVLFSGCNLEESIYVTTTTEEERLDRMDTAIMTCAIIILFIVTNTTWSVIPLVWLANTIVIALIVNVVYLWMVYGYFINCAPVIPVTLMEDINAWYHTRLEPGCFYKTLPFIALNASEDTCLTCSIKQEYTNCADYTTANYKDGMLPLKELISEYNIAWPSLFWIRWKLPEVAIFAVKNGIIELDSIVGRLAMSAWQQEPVDPIWIDCYNAMWLDNILFGGGVVLGSYILTKLTVLFIQWLVQVAFLIMYTYTTLNYMSLAVERSVVIK